jgi:hypothetical protein
VDPLVAQISQHLSIASMKFSEYVPAAATFEMRVRIGSSSRTMTPQMREENQEGFDGARHAQHLVQELWTEIWSQLDGARALAVRLGRDMTMYDETREMARAYGAGAELEVGELQHSSGQVYTQSVKHRVGPPKLMQHATEILLTLVPEAQIIAARDEPVPDLGSSKLGLRIVAAIGIAIVIAIIVAWFSIKR